MKVKVVWSDGKEHGVRFIERPQEPALGGSSPHAVHQDQIESEARGGRVEEILNEARRRIAQVMGLPSEAVEIKLIITS